MKWKAEAIIHYNEPRIALYHDYSKEANKRVQNLTGVKWSMTLKVWQVPDTEDYRKQFKLTAPPATTNLRNVLRHSQAPCSKGEDKWIHVGSGELPMQNKPLQLLRMEN